MTALSTGCPLTQKTKNISPSRPLLSEVNATTTTRTTRSTANPFEKRLNHIRIHLLNNRIHRKLTFSEPTLIFNEFLYLGGIRSLYNKDRLAALNITHILSVILTRPKKSAVSPHIKHLFLKADDSFGFDMTPYFQQACEFIEDARLSNGRVLVHCACGISRSTTLCCAYLIKHHSMSLEEALIHLRSHRHIVQPNPSFLRQLIHYNEQIECDKTTIDTVVEQLENV